MNGGYVNLVVRVLEDTISKLSDHALLSRFNKRNITYYMMKYLKFQQKHEREMSNSQVVFRITAELRDQQGYPDWVMDKLPSVYSCTQIITDIS